MKPIIYYQDEYIIVAYKPYGALSEEHDGKTDMPSLLKAETGCREIYPFHRLDRTTQGLMIYAKTPDAAKRMGEMLRNGEVEKRYLAVVEGIPSPPSGELRDLLYFDRRRNKSFVVKRERKGVKEAVLSYDTLAFSQTDGEDISLLRIRLHTGRTHQIRVQFASRKTPLAGDRRYGSRLRTDEIMLCSSYLCFKHPYTGEEMTFTYEPDNGLFRLFE